LTRVIAGDMPKEGEPLSQREIALLREWIRRQPAPPADERIISEHWAFQAPRLPEIPTDPNFPNPIDAFLGDARVKAGILERSPAADRRLLLRRVTIDLTGLPPTEEEYRDFDADASPQAYENVVDRLLASPRYAERWARHWMDVWRYSSHDERKALKM